MFALRFDGFIQCVIYTTIDDVITAWKNARKNRSLYEYDCVIVEIDKNRQTIRVV